MLPQKVSAMAKVNKHINLVKLSCVVFKICGQRDGGPMKLQPDGEKMCVHYYCYY